VLFDRDKAQAGSPASGAVADGVKDTRHRPTINSGTASIDVHALTFIKRNHQEGGQRWQRHWPPQIGQRLKGPQKGLSAPLVALAQGRVGEALS
jgi:hypothetical protein